MPCNYPLKKFFNRQIEISSPPYNPKTISRFLKTITISFLVPLHVKGKYYIRHQTRGERKSENETRRDDKSIFPIFDNGSMIAINRRQTRGQSFVANRISHTRDSHPSLRCPPSSCNTSSLRPRVIGQRGRGGWNARNPETRLLEVSPWVIVTRCLEAEEIHDNTGRPPKTLREECPTK